MFTKKTRVLSAILSVCMLLSMLVSIAVPVSAEENYDEIQNFSGLTDVSALPDIKDGLASGMDYKVTDRAGMNMLATLVVSNSLSGYTFTMANDIDMGPAPFVGVGATNNINPASTENAEHYIFSGTFDGNGFVFKNAYVSQTTAYGVGLFANCYGATIKNVGIASGLIVGAGYTGSVVGLAHGNTKVINCWNAATIIGGSNTAVGGLIGAVVDGSGSLENSFNLGLIYNYSNAAAGLVGQVRGVGAGGYVIKNCYSAGTIVDGLSAFSNSSHNYFGAILRPESAEVSTATYSADNYYLDTIGKPGWEKGGAVSGVVKDGAVAFKAAEFSTLHQKLNNNISSDFDAYTVEYAYSTAGYPVLTYKVGGSVVAKRLPAADAKNVVGNDWEKDSALFAAVSAKAQSGFRLSSITIDNANDLFVLGMITSFHTSSSNFGIANVTITADIDMDDLTIADVDYYIPIGANGAVKFAIDGQAHTIKNWSSYAYLQTCYVASGGFVSLLAGGSISNLSLENAYSAYDLYYKAMTSSIGYSYPALLVERVRDADSSVSDCSATGLIEIFNKDAANDNNNAGIVGRFWGNVCSVNNSWCEVTAVHSYPDTPFTYSCRVIGSANTVPTASKFSHNYWVSPAELNAPHTGAGDNKIIGTDAQAQMTPAEFHTETMAVTLTDASTAALWTVKMIGTEKRLCRAADESETLAALYYQRYIPTPAGYVTEALPYGEATLKGYYMRGAEIIPESLAGYELDNEQEIPVVMDGNKTVTYYMIAPDYTYVDEARVLLAQYDPDLYGEDGAEVFGKLEAALEKVDNATGKSEGEQLAAIYEVMLYYDAADAYMKGGNMSATYPNLPSISDYETYKNAGVVDWAIKTKADWVYVTSVLDAGIASELRLHLTNDIDMENTNVMPLAYSVGFNGLIDGHGYCFKNFKMHQADANNLGNTTVGNEVSWGLVSYLNSSGVIQNLGIASGSFNITDIGSQEQGVGAFAGVAHASSKIINCWNGASVHAVNKNNPSRVGGIVGRGYCTLYGCYNWGTITGNSAYTHGLNAYAQNGTGKFYNCYSLPAQSTNKASTSAIGQGGSYVSNATAPTSCYQNTWSVANYLIYDTEKLANKAAETFSKAHTLTWGQYESGEMAYTMNNGIASLAGVDPVYWTMNANGDTVHGTAANAVRRLIITMNVEGQSNVSRALYVNGNAEIDLAADGYEVLSYEISKGEATVSGNVLAMNGTDVIIELTVACGHNGTTTYTQNNDGTHDWSCSACNKSGEGVVCEKEGAWQNDAVAGKHSAECVCGRVLSEDCSYNKISAVEGADHHKRYCECGDYIEEDCLMKYEQVGSNGHRHFCTICGRSEEGTCSYGDLIKTKAPTHTEYGSESRSCVCGRTQTYPIAKLTGAVVMAETQVAYAGENTDVDIVLKNPANIAATSIKINVYYDKDVLTYVENQTVIHQGTVISSPQDGYVTFTITKDSGIPADTKLITPKFAVAKGAPTAKSEIRIEVVEADAAVSGTFALLDVWKFAWGDANGDHKSTLADVVKMLRVVNGETDVEIDIAACDVWHDRFNNVGSDRKITLSDATLVLRYVLGEYTPTI